MIRECAQGANPAGSWSAVEDEKIEVEGEVVEALPSTMFRVELESGQQALAKISGKMRRHTIRLLPGDRVKVELSRTTSRAAAPPSVSSSRPRSTR